MPIYDLRTYTMPSITSILSRIGCFSTPVTEKACSKSVKKSYLVHYPDSRKICSLEEGVDNPKASHPKESFQPSKVATQNTDHPYANITEKELTTLCQNLQGKLRMRKQITCREETESPIETISSNSSL